MKYNKYDYKTDTFIICQVAWNINQFFVMY